LEKLFFKLDLITFALLFSQNLIQTGAILSHSLPKNFIADEVYQKDNFSLRSRNINVRYNQLQYTSKAVKSALNKH